MKNWQASCEDGWKSKVVQAKDKDEAANMVKDELVQHVKEVHDMDMPSEPKALHTEIVNHTMEVMM